MGISPQSLYERLNGQEISISTLQGIAEALNISLAELCAKLGDNTPPLPTDEIALLRQENALLRQMLSEKDVIIDKLMQFQRDIQEIKKTLGAK